MNKNVASNKDIVEMAAEAEELTKSILPNYDEENDEEEETVSRVTPTTTLLTYYSIPPSLLSSLTVSLIR